MMSWEAIGAVGESLGAVAVFITLIYLATQVRYAREETRRALSHSRTQSIRELIALGLEDSILQAHVKADRTFSPEVFGPLDMLMSEAGLSREEAARVVMLFVAYWNYVVQIVPVVDSLGESERELFDSFIRTRFASPGTYGELYQRWIKPSNESSKINTYVDAILTRL